MARIIIDTGTTTQDHVKDGFDYINLMTAELYARLGPLAGSKYPEMQMAVKYFQVNRVLPGDLFYIGRIICGTLSGSNYTYTIDIWVTSDVNSAGTKQMTFTTSAPTSAKTGLEYITLAQSGSGGYSGKLLINWSLLTLGTTYTNALWVEGGLFASIPLSSVANIGDEAVSVVTVDETTVDGSKDLYVLNPVAAIDVKSVAYASLKGILNFKNISAFDVTFSGNATETFDGIGGTVTIAAGESCVIRPYDSNFILQAGGTIVPTP